MKKVLAHILDFFFLALLYWLTVIVLSLSLVITFRVLNINFRELFSYNPTAKDILDIGRVGFMIFIFYAYYTLIPRKIGNTFGGKILKIRERLGYRRSVMEYCKEYLTTWVCPACGTRYKDDEVKFCVKCNPKNKAQSK